MTSLLRYLFECLWCCFKMSPLRPSPLVSAPRPFSCSAELAVCVAIECGTGGTESTINVGAWLYTDSAALYTSPTGDAEVMSTSRRSLDSDSNFSFVDHGGVIANESSSILSGSERYSRFRDGSFGNDALNSAYSDNTGSSNRASSYCE